MIEKQGRAQAEVMDGRNYRAIPRRRTHMPENKKVRRSAHNMNLYGNVGIKILPREVCRRPALLCIEGAELLGDALHPDGMTPGRSHCAPCGTHRKLG